MNDRVLQVLEYFKIREQVVQECITAYGRERAQDLRPLSTRQEVLAALALTSDGDTVYRLKGLPPLPRTGDVRLSVVRAQKGGILGATEMVGIAITARSARHVQRFVSELLERTALPALSDWLEPLGISRVIEQEVFACLDEDALMLDHASPELSTIRREMRTVQERMKRTLDEMVRAPQTQRYLQDTIVTMRRDRYCLAVKAESQGQVRGVIHDQSASGSTLFIEPERVARLGNELMNLRSSEEREIERILQRLTGVVMEHSDALLAAITSLGVVDFSLAKAIYAKRDKAILPQVSDQAKMQIHAGRHPLLPKETVVPLDVRLGVDFRLLVITGPNTGGKTVALKTMGLLTLMALSGLFIPAAAGSEIGFYREVYADIGDEQSIEQNLSTFSSHMTHIVQILRDADAESLVLFDELGAGTDPTEGAALAMAILDDLRLRHTCTVATTHYSELKAYAYTTPDTMNASVEFDLATLSPTYRLLVGVPGRSNAFAIAQRLGLRRDLIAAAQEKLSTNDVAVEDLIAQLQHRVMMARQEEERAHASREHARRLEQELAHAREHEEQEHARRKAKADEEIRQSVRKAQREAEELLQELREMKTAGMKFKDHEVATARKTLEQLLPGQTLSIASRHGKVRDFQVGDEVRVLTLAGQKATVLEVPTTGEELLVAVGAMKMKVDRSNLELLRTKNKVETPVTFFRRTSETVLASLDLRGETVEGAIREVDTYLDRALLAGFHQVTLIHGKGTGALRNGLESYLRSHSHVLSARAGGQGEGGSGVTVVELS